MTEEDPPQRRSLPSRTTRGARLTSADAEGDEEFWNQEFFAEEAEDKDYQTEVEEEDVVDADFDDAEDDDDADAEDEGKGSKRDRDPTAAKKKSVYVDPLLKKKGGKAGAKAAKQESDSDGEAKKDKGKGKRKVVERRAAGPSGEGEASTSRGTRGAAAAAADDSGAAGPVRKSQRTHVTQRNAERERVAAINALKQQPKKRGPVEFRRLTQEEMLAEAAQTELYNAVSLQRLLRIEEEKKRLAAPKPPYEGPKICFKSRDGRNTITFTQVSQVPEAINAKAPSYPPRAVCVVTGLPAKYRHPHTGAPYATLDAYRIIHNRYLEGVYTKNSGKLEQLQQTLEQKQRKRHELKAGRLDSPTAPFSGIIADVDEGGRGYGTMW